MGKRTNHIETATGKCWLKLRNERIMNPIFQKKSGRIWSWKSQSGVEKAEMYYKLTNRPDIVTDVAIINHVNIGNDHRMAMRKRKQLMTKRPPRVYASQIGSKRSNSNSN